MSMFPPKTGRLSLVFKLLALKPRLYPLYAETVIISALVRLCLLNGKYNFPRHSAKSEGSVPSRTVLNNVVLAVTRIAKYTPWRCLCYEQSLTTQVMLARRNIHSTLFLGVSHDSHDKLIAHAWLQVKEEVLMGDGDLSRFCIVATFP